MAPNSPLPGVNAPDPAKNDLAALAAGVVAPGVPAARIIGGTESPLSDPSLPDERGTPAEEDEAVMGGLLLRVDCAFAKALLIPLVSRLPDSPRLGRASAELVLLRGPALPLTSRSVSLAMASLLTNSDCSNWTTTNGREACELTLRPRAWMTLTWS